MRRADLLKIVGITTGAYNNLVARDLLPFPLRTRGEQWGDYTADDAFRLALMVKMGATCWEQLAATTLVRKNFAKLKAAAKASAHSSPPWMFGSVWLINDRGLRAPFQRQALIAPQGQVEQTIRSQLGTNHSRLSHWAVIDATAVVGDLYRRATEEKLTSARLTTLAHLFGVPR